MNAWRCALICSALMLACAANRAGAVQPSGEPTQLPRQPAARQDHLPLGVFTAVFGDDETKALAALDRIERHWHESSSALLIEMIHRAPSRRVLARQIASIEKASGRPFDGDVDAWYEWLWSPGRAVHPDYPEFKALLYASIDARFREYFEGRPKSVIHETRCGSKCPGRG